MIRPDLGPKIQIWTLQVSTFKPLSQGERKHFHLKRNPILSLEEPFSSVAIGLRSKEKKEWGPIRKIPRIFIHVQNFAYMLSWEWWNGLQWNSCNWLSTVRNRPYWISVKSVSMERKEAKASNWSYLPYSTSDIRLENMRRIFLEVGINYEYYILYSVHFSKERRHGNSTCCKIMSSKANR